MKKIVFFDFFEINLGKGKSIGIYNYALNLLRALSHNDHFTIVVACNGENVQAFSQINNVKCIVLSDYFPSFLKRLLWRYFYAIRVAKKQCSDIYFSPKGFAPGLFRRKKKPYIVVTVHDMIPFYYKEQFPGYFGFWETHLVTFMLKHSIKISNRVITVSNYSKKAIDSYVLNNNSFIDVVYNGLDDTPFVEDSSISSPYIFAISSNLPHKNKYNLIEGYLSYQKNALNPLHLKICGLASDDFKLSEQQKKYIEFIGYADNDYFYKLYKSSSLFLFVPLIEGFGFPPLEALSFNVPSVVSDIPVFRELLHSAAFFVDPKDPLSIANGLNMALNDPSLCEKVLAEGNKILKNFSWYNCATETALVFDRI